MEGHDRQRYKAWPRMMMMMDEVQISLLVVECAGKINQLSNS